MVRLHPRSQIIDLLIVDLVGRSIYNEIIGILINFESLVGSPTNLPKDGSESITSWCALTFNCR
jgi:hypothetical protein